MDSDEAQQSVLEGRRITKLGHVCSVDEEGLWTTYDLKEEEKTPSTDAEIAFWREIRRTWKALDSARGALSVLLQRLLREN